MIVFILREVSASFPPTYDNICVIQDKTKTIAPGGRKNANKNGFGMQVISNLQCPSVSLFKNASIHGVTTMLATSRNVLFPGHNQLLTTGTDDPSLAGAQAIIKVSGHQYRWLTAGYDLEIGHF